MRLNPAESEALDELAGLLRRSRVDSCREAIWGYLRKVRVTGGEVTTRGIERMHPTEQSLSRVVVPERTVELDDREPNPLVDARRPRVLRSDQVEQHADRHDGCGGEWVGGVCCRCEALCECSVCRRARARMALGDTARTADELEGVWPPKEE